MTAEGFFDEAKLKASLLSPDEAVREQTLGGSLIGAARDLVSAQPADDYEASARAASNDMFAELAVDTFALMPGVSWAKAGGARTAFLLNPNAGALDNALWGSVNFAEGIALNRVGKMGAKFMQPTPGVSRTLTSESLGLFKFGFGMGAVKATFDEHTWVDKDKQFQAGGGLLNIAKAGIVGGAIGVPAGMVGSRAAKFGMHHLAESGLSPRALSVGLGMASGYPAGAVFGGVDTVLHGGTVSQFFKSAHEGGLVGMATGGLSGLALPHEIAIANQKGTMLGGDRRKLVFEAGAPASERTEMGRGKKSRPASSEGIPIELYTRLGMKVSHDLEANLLHLGAPVPGTITCATARLNAPQIAKKIAASAGAPTDAAYHKFVESATIRTEEPALVYKLRDVEVVVPESYARELDRVYQLRITRDKGMKPGATPAEVLAAGQAALGLKGEPLHFSAHPADLVALGQLPDRGLVKRIEIHPTANAEDHWHSATYKPNFVSAATASSDGTLAYYKPRLTSNLSQITHHEWGHFLKSKAPKESSMFDFAAALEQKAHGDRSKPGYSTSEYANRNIDENWAEHSADITQAEPAGYFQMAQDAPLRTAVLGRAMDRSLKSVSAQNRSDHHDLLVDRVVQIKQHVEPKALELMEHYLKKGNDQEKIAAARLLGHFGDEPQLKLLKEAAKHDPSPEVRTAAFDLAANMAQSSEVHPTGYLQYAKSKPRFEYENFLIEMAAPDSRSKVLALSYLRKQPGARAEGYCALLGPAETDHTRIRSLLDAMKKIPEQPGKEEAFLQAVRIRKGHEDLTFELGIQVMQQVPELRGQSLDLLMRTNLAKTEPILKDLADKPLHKLHERAQVGLAKLETERHLSHLKRRAQDPNVVVREDAIRDLGRTKEYAAIRPLLERVRAGTPAEVTLARQVLADNFNHQIVKEEIRKLVQADPTWRACLQPLVNNR